MTDTESHGGTGTVAKAGGGGLRLVPEALAALVFATRDQSAAFRCTLSVPALTLSLRLPLLPASLGTLSGADRTPLPPSHVRAIARGVGHLVGDVLGAVMGRSR